MRVQRLTSRTVSVLLAALLSCAVFAGVAWAAWGRTLSVDLSVRETVRESALLVAAPDLGPGGGRELNGAQGAALTADLATRIPLPAGGDLDGIAWAEFDGTISAAIAQAVVEYNAACQWYRALRDGRQVAAARRIIADIPRWQATRDGETGALAAAVAADVAAGGGPVLTGVLRQCDAAQGER